MDYSYNNNEDLILPDITKSSIRTKENGASNYYQNQNEDYPYNKLKSNMKSKYESSPYEYAEAFNQIKNAKFKVLSKIERLKQAKSQRNDDYDDYQENYNQVYNYLNNNDNRELTKYSQGKIFPKNESFF